MGILATRCSGPPLCRIYEGSAIGPLPSEAPPPPSLRVFARRGLKMLKWWVRGLARPSPFFEVANGMARWHFLELVNFIATELHKGFGPLWHPTSAGGREIAIENLSKRFDSLDRQLGDQSYLRGETFTIADAYAYAVLNWTKIHKIDMRRWPRLTAFLDRVAARPAVLRTLLRRDSRKHNQPKVTNLEFHSVATLASAEGCAFFLSASSGPSDARV